uniref:Uncharacterized protein n=1 Tax=Romanomermis culicivorax TaxID=13658 RepID=A0A915INY2_ROMCU
MIKNGEKLKVCKEFFLRTLDISHRRIPTAFEKTDECNTVQIPSHQGKHAPKHKLKAPYRQAVIDHINSFQKVPSHYCRQSTQRDYLDSRLSIRQMHQMFQDWDERPLSCVVSLETYRKNSKQTTIQRCSIDP